MHKIDVSVWLSFPFSEADGVPSALSIVFFQQMLLLERRLFCITNLPFRNGTYIELVSIAATWRQPTWECAAIHAPPELPCLEGTCEGKDIQCPKPQTSFLWVPTFFWLFLFRERLPRWSYQAVLEKVFYTIVRASNERRVGSLLQFVYLFCFSSWLCLNCVLPYNCEWTCGSHLHSEYCQWLLYSNYQDALWVLFN